MNNMKLPEGIVADLERTFGSLKFQALHSVSYKRDEEGKATSELDHRTYDLRSDVQKGAVQVILPGNVPEKNISYLALVKLVNVKLETYASSEFRDTDATWIVRADDIIPIDAKTGGDAAKTGAASAGASQAQGVDQAKVEGDAAKAGAPQQTKKG